MPMRLRRLRLRACWVRGRVNHQAVADEALAACFASEDYKEGRKAFMEKRKRVWTGR